MAKKDKVRCLDCSTPVVGADGLCKPCRIGRKEGPEARIRYMQDLGRRGAYASRKRPKGLEADELPPLDSPQAAEAWLEAIGRAVATGRLGHNEGKAVVSAVQQWLRAHEAGAVSERVEQLREQLQELQRGKLQAVK